MELLWPESDEMETRHRFRQLLYSVKKSLEVDLGASASIVTDSHFITLNIGDASVDALMFEECHRGLSRASKDSERLTRLNRIVDLYTGPFLEGLDDSWILHQRSRYENAFCRSACELSELYCLLSDPHNALRIAHRALDFQPMREDLHVAAMRAYGWAGEAAQALRQFEMLERILSEEFGERPSDWALQALKNLPAPQYRPIGLQLSTVPPDRSALFPQFAGTLFIGRANDVAALWPRIDPSRPNTSPVNSIVGPPGVGKTRLAAELARLFSECAGVNCWLLVPPQGATSSQLLSEFAILLNLNLDLQVSVCQQAALAIGNSPSLLVLDDCDHSMEAVAEFAARLVSSCRGLRVLVTSRSGLNLEGNRAFMLSPLSVTSDPNMVEECPSCQLFVAAAQRAQPGFVPDDACRGHIVKICELAEGLPLAVCLAASRVGVLRPKQIVEALEHSNGILKSSVKQLSHRQHSLEKTILWTFQTLTIDGQNALARLAWLEGSFSVETAAIALGHSPSEAVQELQGLFDGSWIQLHLLEDVVRVSILRPIREFARQECPAACAKQVIDRVAAHLADWLSDRSALLCGPFASATVRQISLELPLLLGLLRSDLLDVGTAQGVVGVLGRYFELVPSSLQWRDVVRVIASSQSTDTVGAGRAAMTLGQLEFSHRDFERAVNAFNRARQTASLMADDVALVAATNGLAVALGALGRPDDSLPLLQAARIEARRRGLGILEWKTCINLGYALEWLGRLPEAFELYNEALSVAETLSDLRLQAVALEALSQVRELGLPSDIQIEQLQRAVRSISLSGDERTLAYATANFGLALCLAGSVSDGIRLMVDCAEFDARDNEWRSLRTNLAAIALAATKLDRHQMAKEALRVRQAVEQLAPGPKLSMELQIEDWLDHEGVTPSEGEQLAQTLLVESVLGLRNKLLTAE